MRKQGLIVLFAFVVCIDQLTKSWAMKVFTSDPWAFSSNCNLLLAWNRGISWSLFATNDALGFWMLTSVIAATVATFAVYTLWRFLNHYPVLLEMLVLGGAVSNLVDRLQYGAVVDFIELYVGTFYWPAFNIADICIVVGIIGMFIRNFIGDKPHERY